MIYAINILESQREDLVCRLKSGDKSCLKQLQSVNRALNWLRLLHQNHLDEFKNYEVTELPFIDGRGGFTYYRIMIDNESENKMDWDEYEIDGKNIVLSGMDYIIQMK